ncbi:hypothetical protein JOB18_003604 [Solea senegalensis]|uniref:Uncharacterized protein n=1 Tax=Solea senegalensis TaxID=28829 RepID=A0AAV6Q0Q0_SOLSE|nr:hypothetical protein JOB18_003604 [Solea senegalensis]
MLLVLGQSLGFLYTPTTPFHQAGIPATINQSGDSPWILLSGSGYRFPVSQISRCFTTPFNSAHLCHVKHSPVRSLLRLK